jgi:diguanylate cyclase (GGDEF)-like protein
VPAWRILTDKKNGQKKLVERLKAGDILGVPSFIRNARLAVTAIAAEPVELLQIDRRMIRRLQWLYPPAAHKFLLNLMALLCNRLEGLSQRFQGFDHKKSVSGLLNIELFLKTLETAVEKARNHNKNLSLGLMEIEITSSDLSQSGEEKDRVFNWLTNILAKKLRNKDILSRLDSRTLVILMPDTALHKAERIYNRLRKGMEPVVSEEAREPSFVATYGLVELEPGDETGWDLLSRATQAVHNSEETRKITVF